MKNNNTTISYFEIICSTAKEAEKTVTRYISKGYKPDNIFTTSNYDNTYTVLIYE
jgi:hypothetical protein